LGLGVITVLTRQARILGRDAGPIGAVAGRACGHTLGRNAATVDLFTQAHQILVLGKAFLGLLAAIERREVADVGIGEWFGHALHDRILADGGLEFVQLLGQIGGVLALQNGVGGGASRAVNGVTSHAHLGGLGF